MKKRLMAAALGGLFASVAQAQTSVVLYGIADGDLRFDHTSIGTLKSVGSGGESGSRWGIRGTEDLGGGLKASFNFEQGIDLSDNSVPQGNVSPTTPTSPVSSTGSRTFSRTATVGLSSNVLGELRFGRAYTPMYVAWTTVDPMAGGLVGGAQNYAVGNVTRYDNAMYYDSPKFYGLQLSGAFRLGEASTDSVASGADKQGGQSYNAVLSYANGPIYAAASWLATKSSLDNNTTRTAFGGVAYDFKFVKLAALYFNTRNSTTTDQVAYALGFTVPIKAFSVFGQVGRIDNRYDQNGSSLGGDDAMFYGVGGNYAFSKRTDVYVSFSKFNNKHNAQYAIQDAGNFGLMTSGATGNITTGFDPYSYQVGIRHRF